MTPDACHEDGFPPGSWTDAAARHGQAGAWHGTLAAQRALWFHQNPPDCKSSKFFIITAIPDSGIGSSLHTISALMGYGMNLDRIVLLGPNSVWWAHDRDARNKFCAGDGSGGGFRNTLDSCYFLPLSNCTLADAGVNSNADLKQLPRFTDCRRDEQPPEQQLARAIKGKFQYRYERGCGNSRPLPHFLVDGILRGGPMREDRWHYWWRGQAMTYLVRPNARTQRDLDNRCAHA